MMMIPCCIPPPLPHAVSRLAANLYCIVGAVGNGVLFVGRSGEYELKNVW